MKRLKRSLLALLVVTACVGCSPAADYYPPLPSDISGIWVVTGYDTTPADVDASDYLFDSWEFKDGECWITNGKILGVIDYEYDGRYLSIGSIKYYVLSHTTTTLHVSRPMENFKLNIYLKNNQL